MDMKDDLCNMHMGKHVHKYDIGSLEPLLSCQES